MAIGKAGFVFALSDGVREPTSRTGGTEGTVCQEGEIQRPQMN